MKKSTWLVLTALVILSWAQRPVRADDDMRGACSADVQKFCSDVQPGGGRIITCLKNNQNQLSSGCTAEIAQVRAKIQEAMKNFQASCGDDVKKFCPNVTPGHGREVVCLQQHTQDLTSACQQELSNMHTPLSATPINAAAPATTGSPNANATPPGTSK